MEIIKLPKGIDAPVDGDSIVVEERSDGTCLLDTSVLNDCPESDDAESDATIFSAPYPDYEAAEAAGLAIADENCVETVYVSHERANDG